MSEIEATTVAGRLADIIEFDTEVLLNEYRLSSSDRAVVVKALRDTDRIEALEAALREIAGQHLSDVMTEDQLDYADWIGGYDALVTIARTALAPEQNK